MTKLLTTLMMSTVLAPGVALAQAREPEPQSQSPVTQLGEIIVTAQRYEQRLQDVPLSVSVVGREEIAARGASELKDLQYSVPGLSTYEFGPGRQTVQLRGVSNSIGSSTIGIYLDETPLALDQQGDAFNVRLLDMDRIEVLRGPQATLYGQGSMGGTIRYIPAAPRLDATGGAFVGEYSQTEDGDEGYKTVGVLNLPLVTGRLGVRLVAGYEKGGGFIDSLSTGEEDINSAETYTLRGVLLARPSDRLSITLTALHQDTTQRSQDFGTNRQSSALLREPVEDQYSLLQGKLSYDLDFADLSASVYRVERSTSGVTDISGLYVPVLNVALGLPPGFIDRVGLLGSLDYAIWGGELRLASHSDGPLTWQVGATYRDLEQLNDSETFTAPGALPFTVIKVLGHNQNASVGVYGEASYAFTSRLTATVGARYFYEDKTSNLVNSSLGVTTVDVGDASFDSINPRFNLSYEVTPDTMVFANAAKGFRSGGFNNTSSGGGVFVIPPTYDSDEIWTYEVGFKTQRLERKLLLDASVYRSEWSKVQSYSFAPGSALAAVTNSGDVAGWGADLAVTARPTTSLTLTATYGWNNLEFQNATADKLPGDPVDGAIRESYSASLDYRPRLTDAVTGLLRLDYQHAGAGAFTVRNYTPPAITERPARDLVNLRVGASIGDLEIALFANNLFDEDAPNIVGPFGTITENVEQRPRVVGLSLNTRF